MSGNAATTTGTLTKDGAGTLTLSGNSTSTYTGNTTVNSGTLLVTGTLVEYTRHPLTFQPSDVFTTRDYEIRLTARVLAVDRSTGKTLIDRSISGRVPVRSAPDLGSAERQAAPVVAEQLARNITTILVDGNW
jgi:autotransporter-associated beta strand protein